MATTTPTWTDNVSVIAAAVLARGSTSRGTLDLRAKRGAYVLIRIGRGGTTALTNGADVLIRRTINNDAAIHPAPTPHLVTSIAAAASTTVDADSNSGQADLNVTSESGFAAGDLICIQDSGGGVTRLEFARVSKVASGVLTLDANLKTSHTGAQADTVRNKSDLWSVWIDGGATYEVVIDYGDDAAGESLTVEVKAQTYDSDTTA